VLLPELSVSEDAILNFGIAADDLPAVVIHDSVNKLHYRLPRGIPVTTANVQQHLRHYLERKLKADVEL
jgi:hypothetical protein